MSADDNILKLIAQAAPYKEWEGEPVNILTDTIPIQRYTPGLLPQAYESAIYAKASFWGTSLELYAGMFMTTVAMNTNVHVLVEPFAGAGRESAVNVIEYAGLVGASGTHKSPITDDMSTQHIGPMADWCRETTSRACESKNAITNKEERKAFKVPQLKLNQFTIESLIDITGVNVRSGVPTNVLGSELYHILQGGAAHNAEAYASLADPLKTAYDNRSHSGSTVSKGILNADRIVLNLHFCTTPVNLLEWKGLQTALEDGLLGRFNVFTASEYTHPKTAKVLDPEGTMYRLHAVLRVLQKLPPILLRLESAIEVQETVDKMIRIGNRLADDHQPAAAWIKKLQTRLARTAAAFHLIEHADHMIQDGALIAQTPVPELIPKQTVERAWRFIEEFIWPQQKHFYTETIAGGELGSALTVTVKRIVAAETTEVSREFVCGSKSTNVVRKWWKENNWRMIDTLLRALWLRNIIKPQPARRNQLPIVPGKELEQASWFDVHPNLSKVYAGQIDDIKEETALMHIKLQENMTRRGK